MNIDALFMKVTIDFTKPTIKHHKPHDKIALHRQQLQCEEGFAGNEGEKKIDQKTIERENLKKKT